MIPSTTMKAPSSLPFEQIPRTDPLPERIYRQIHEKIANGEIDPSVRMTETQLAAMLGVSRTPLREALTRLRHEGLLAAGRGTSVASLSRMDLEEIMELRLLIEPYLAARAATLATPQGLRALDEVVRREVAALPRPALQKFVMANHDFRVVLVGLAGNKRLAEAASRHDSQIQALRRATLEKKSNRETVVRHHQLLVAALGRHDAQAAETIMRDLMLQARESILALIPAPRS